MGDISMQVITQDLISGKKVLLRYDIDVALGKGTGDRVQAEGTLRITEDYKLKAGLETLKLCLEHGSNVIMMGHIGRPNGKVVHELSVEPIRQWLVDQGYGANLGSGRLSLLENFRFDRREEACDPNYAQELASMGDVYINEAFSAHRPSASITVLPTLLPHGAGLHFAEEVKTLIEIRNNPKKPFIAIMGGAKVTDKLLVIKILAEKADAVLIGGKLVAEIKNEQVELPKNVMVGKLNEDGFDIAEETVASWSGLISKAAMIVWNGPLGKFEEEKYNQTENVAKIVLQSNAKIVIGGGDIIAAFNQYGLLPQAESKAFVSVGGGAMLKLISDGTLPTIEALK